MRAHGPSRKSPVSNTVPKRYLGNVHLWRHGTLTPIRLARGATMFDYQASTTVNTPVVCQIDGPNKTLEDTPTISEIMRSDALIEDDERELVARPAASSASSQWGSLSQANSRPAFWSGKMLGSWP